MKHDPFSLTELIRNDEFIAWVLHPDPISDLRWEKFLRSNPGKRLTIELGKEYVLLIAKDTGKQMPTLSQSEKMRKAIERGIQNDGSSEAT